MKERWLSLFIVAVCLASTGVAVSCRPAATTQEQRAGTSTGSDPGPSAVPAAKTAQPARQDERPVIVTFGDSLTAGVAGRSYPDDVQDLLDANGFHYRVDNQGVSGDTTTDGLARIDNVLSEHPALVILEFGGNDGLRGIPVDSTRSNLQQLIGRLKSAHIPLVLLGITLPPNYGPEYVKPFTAMFPELARQYHLPYMPFLLLHIYQHHELMQPDGIHPNGEGNKIVAGDVFNLIRPMLSRHGKRPGTP